jgi:ADP-heptose:LPS heptosyltransferase
MIIERRGKEDRTKRVLVVILEGGIGDHLLATPMIRGLRAKYPMNEWTIVLLAMFHEVFGYQDPEYNDADHFICMNPNIDHLYSMRMPSNFYSEWARNADAVLSRNPYHMSPHRLGAKHMAHSICDLYEVRFDQLRLDYYMTAIEDLQARKLFQTFDNPVVVVHPCSALDPVKKIKVGENKDWYMDRWQGIVSWLVNKNYEVIQIGLKGEPILNNVFSMVGNTTVREVAGLVKYADFFISIDSLLVHFAKAFNRLGVVLWGRTNPYRVGYTEHSNLFKLHSCPELFCGRPEGQLFDISPDNPYFTPWQCPHRNCMESITVYDVSKAIENLEKLLRLNPATYIREDYAASQAKSRQPSPSQ